MKDEGLSVFFLMHKTRMLRLLHFCALLDTLVSNPNPYLSVHLSWDNGISEARRL